MIEEWKDIEGYEGRYQVSNHGHIRTCARFVNTQWTTPRYLDSQIMKPYFFKYYYVSLASPDGRKKRIKLHRLVAKAFIPNPDNKPYVDHKDGDVHNNCVSNLRWATNSDNQANQKPVLRNTSGYRGVSFHKYRKKWTAAITKDRIKIHLGDYAEPEAAALVYNEAAVKYYGEFARLNELKTA